MSQSPTVSKLLLISLASFVSPPIGFGQPTDDSPTVAVRGTGNPIRQFLLSDDGSTLVLCDDEGNAATQSWWDPVAEPTIRFRDRLPELLAIDSDTGLLAIYTRDHGVEVLGMWTDEPARMLERGDVGELRGLAFARGGAELIGRTVANEVVHWSLETGRISKQQPAPPIQEPLAISADGLSAIGMIQGRPVIWDVAKSAERAPLEGIQGELACVAISPSGRLAAASITDSPEQVNIWETDFGHLLQTLIVPGAPKSSLKFSKNDETLVVIDSAGLVSSWQIGTGAELGKFPLPSARRSCSVSDDGSRVAWPNQENSVSIHAVPSELDFEERSAPMMAEPGAGAPDEAPSDETGAFDEDFRSLPTRDLATANGHDEAEDVEAVDESSESKDITFVNVFFGTNRRNDYAHTWFGYFAGFFFTTVSVAIYCLFILVLIAALFIPRRATHAAIGTLLAALLVGAAIYAQSKTGRHFYTVADQFGPVGGKLTYGNCIVSVPPCHEPGEMESPLTVWVYRGAEKPDKHIMVQHLERRTPEEFIRLLNQELDDSPGKSALVFIHGYNVCFRDAIRRTAQLAVDLEFPGPAICFSWPSHADPVRYPFDARNAKASKTALRDFLRYILANSNAEKIHLVAHSMGNLVLAEGLQLLEPEERDRFGYLVMAAPDIDREEFLDPIAPAIARGQLHVTLYASSRDNALRLSKKFHNYQRAGDSLPDLTLCDGVETIDASRVDTSLLGHSYYGDRPTMIKDLGALLIGNKRAAERLADTANEFNGQTYWYIVPE